MSQDYKKYNVDQEQNQKVMYGMYTEEEFNMCCMLYDIVQDIKENNIAVGTGDTVYFIH